MKRKILLIDDDEDLLRSFQVTLENHGFDVITGTDSKIGFLMLKNDKPDLLVLDVMMNTNLEGYNLLHVIKNDPEYKNMPIIMLTGMRDLMGVNLYSAVEDESLFPNVRFQDKPINPHFLVEIIEEMLKG
jgi:two-component system, OmpR family, alkaline phosphatase synthesis response regulator PhoP